MLIVGTILGDGDRETSDYKDIKKCQMSNYPSNTTVNSIWGLVLPSLRTDHTLIHPHVYIDR